MSKTTLCEYTLATPAADVEKRLISLGYKIRQRKPNQPTDVICAHIDGPDRVQTLTAIADELDGTYDSKPIGSISSIGCVKADKARIIVKSKGHTGSATAGIENENALIASVKAVCDHENPITLQFSDSHGKKFTCKDVIDAVSVGKDTKDSKKADVLIVGLHTTWPISIKKDTAAYWGSCTRWAETAYDVIVDKTTSGEAELTADKNGIHSLSPRIAWKATDSQANEIIFGSDIQKQNGCIIQKTFGNKACIQVAADVFNVDVTYIFTKLSDIPQEKRPYFYIQNAKSFTLAHKIKGLRLLAIRKDEITGPKRNVLVVKSV